MRRSRRSILLAGSLVAFSATHTAAQHLCKPVLSIRDARISQAHNLQRTWTGVLVADALSCSTMSGPFEIQFTRLKEDAPDLGFTERFMWASGETELSLNIWWDEWVQDYRIDRIASCPCRD